MIKLGNGTILVNQDVLMLKVLNFEHFFFRTAHLLLATMVHKFYIDQGLVKLNIREEKDTTTKF